MIKAESISYTYDGNLNFNFPDIHLSEGDSLLVLEILELVKLHFFIFS